MGWGFDIFQKFAVKSSNSLPTGKSFRSIATKFPHPGLHIAVHPKAGPKKGTIKKSPKKKKLQSLFINVAASPNIHVPVTDAIIRFNVSVKENEVPTAKDSSRASIFAT